MKCLDQETSFDIRELFFSTTDKKGVVRAGNDVFIRVSGYSEDELIGYAHSKIRHPDMPASVFRVFWNILQSGHSVAAYVKNRSKDGRYYWVMAVATPVDDGYLSVRLKPTSELLSSVAKIYAQVLAIEAAARDTGTDKEGIVQMGLTHLHQEIRGLGFENYEAFMRHALTVEMTVRNETLHHHSVVSRSTSAAARRSIGSRQPPAQMELAAQNDACDKLMSHMLSKLATLNSANREFLNACVAISSQSDVIGSVAMNAQLSANTPVLEAISRELANSEVESRQEIQQMNECVNNLILSLVGLAFNISVAALQSQIATHFLSETRTLNDPHRQNNLQLLMKESVRRVQLLSTELDRAPNWFNELNSLTVQLQRSAKRLRFIRMAGVTESARLKFGHEFAGLFDQVNENIVTTLKLCDTLGDQSLRCKGIMRELLRLKSQLVMCVQDVQNSKSTVVSTY